MKKLLSVLTAGAMLTGLASAEISFGMWGRSSIFAGHENTSTDKTVTFSSNAIADGALSSMGMDVATALKDFGSTSSESSSRNYVDLQPDWSYGSRVGFWIIGRDAGENIGFDFNLDSDASAFYVRADGKTGTALDDDYGPDEETGKFAVTIGDQAKLWAKLGFFKFQFGRIQEDTLRGSIGDFGNREVSAKSEDDIFSRFWTRTALLVSATPVEGLWVGASVDPWQAGDGDTDISMFDAAHTIQAGVGYTVPGLVQVKAQFKGDQLSTNFKNTYTNSKGQKFTGEDYYGRLEFGIDFLPFMGANSIGEVDLDQYPNANLIEWGLKIPLVMDDDLRGKDPETFYNWYSCLGTMGVIEKGFILYKAHLWGGMGQLDYTANEFGATVNDMAATDADALMAGIDALAEVCINPYGKQDVFVGLSGNYNIAYFDGSKSGTATLNGLTADYTLDVTTTMHNIGAEIYLKKALGSNGYIFAGIADTMTLTNIDISFSGSANVMGATATMGADRTDEIFSNKIYMPIGIELYF